MIKKIVSKKIELPTIYLVETEEDFKELPKGLPYIIGTEKELPFIVTYLEFQVLFRSCKKTKLAINWLLCLERLGYKNLRHYKLNSGGTFIGSGHSGPTEVTMDEFVQDPYLVDFDALAALKVLPVWLDDLRASIETNIINEVAFDPTAFNKQLGLNVGAPVMKTNKKNLLILDVSGSIPRGVVKTITGLAKLMSKKFYADVMITSGKTVLIDYEQVPNSDIIQIAKDSGSGNEGIMYQNIVKQHLEYGNIISFGDDDHPGYFGNIREGEQICNIKVDTLISLHTNSRSENITGYARWFKPKTVKKVTDWVKTIE